MTANSQSTPSPALLVATGVALGVAATALLQTLVVSSITQQSETTSANHHHKKKSASSFPLELRQEQLSRHTLFFGENGMSQLKNAKVCVVGAGGVGSHTVCSLIRAGVGYLRVIDFDQVSLSSLNRHACATLEHVGIPKVTVLALYASQLCPDSQYLTVDTRVEMYTVERGHELLQLNDDHTNDDQWDMIIDCIDDVPTKAQLIYDAWKLRVRCLSCMGAAGKADFTRLHMSDLKSASRDPLATKLRQCIKKLIPTKAEADEFMEDADRLAICFSSEKTVQKLADFTPEQKESGTALADFGAVQGMRIRILPVLGTMPAIMGQALAATCLTELAGQPFQPVTGERVGRNVRNKLFQKLTTREDKLRHQLLQDYNVTNPVDIERYKTLGGAMELVEDDNDDATNNVNDGQHKKFVWMGPLQIDGDDIEYILEVWKGRCAITGARLGVVLELIRWDESRPSTCDNLILVANHAKKTWDENGRNPQHLDWGIRHKIEAKLATCRPDSKA